MSNSGSLPSVSPPLVGVVDPEVWPLAPDNLQRTMEWKNTGPGLCSAETRLDSGGAVYLSVERLGSKNWDWLVWDFSCQARPRYGVADTESKAKRLAELTLIEVNRVLHKALFSLEMGGTVQGAAGQRR